MVRKSFFLTPPSTRASLLCWELSYCDCVLIIGVLAARVAAVTAYGQSVFPVLAAKLPAAGEEAMTLPHTWGLLSTVLAHSGGALLAPLKQLFDGKVPTQGQPGFDAAADYLAKQLAGDAAVGATAE